MKRFAAITGILLMSAYVCAEDYSFDVPGAERSKDALEWSGNLDVKYSVFRTGKDSPVYELQYYGRRLSDVLSSYRMELYLNGDYRTRDIGVHLKTHSEYYGDNQADFGLYELYGDVNLSDNSFLLVGKKMYNWGKGYAFNPVGYVNPLKDPENPELSQTGLFSVNYEYSRSFQTELIKNMALDLIAIPSANTINNKISEIESTYIAGKLYFLFLDTDIDFMHYSSRINSVKTGVDFSRNVLPNLEMHGEFSSFHNQPSHFIANNILETKYMDGSSYLFGIRWLNNWNVTTILEYYHNDAGLTAKEYEDYNNFLLVSVASGNTDTISSAINTVKNNFSGTNLMQDYLYLKISWPEPFNWVYFTPSVYTIVNTADRSSVVGVPLSYKPVTNLEIILWPAFFVGGTDTEFGGKQYENKSDMWVRFYF